GRTTQGRAGRCRRWRVDRRGGGASFDDQWSRPGGPASRISGARRETQWRGDVKTGDLIRALAADSAIHPMPPDRALALALIPGVAIALGLHFAVLGLRPHLLTLLGEPRLLFKLCLTFLLVALSGPLVLRLVRPGAGVRRAALMLAI